MMVQDFRLRVAIRSLQTAWQPEARKKLKIMSVSYMTLVTADERLLRCRDIEVLPNR